MERKMYTKCELARLYLPHIEGRSATNRLMSWIKRSEPTMQKLVAAGYYPTQKYFSPRQVDILIDFLGEP